MDREEIMLRWDSWIKYYQEGGKASWPRDAFESLLDELLADVMERSSVKTIDEEIK